ncbi:hypothetical protein EZV62_005858 [Acer yangbiense]|uniref:Secreted protein n=1 Tax=Acer yangbiense TaxID=1000413 RepID=A0A5C7INJ4_9ROSI|nr:hypothetical protein EZV62_005858 [Acer yangbiense]
MAAKKKLNSGVEIVVVLVLLTCAPSRIHSADDNRLLVNMTLVPNSTASALGACNLLRWELACISSAQRIRRWSTQLAATI